MGSSAAIWCSVRFSSSVKRLHALAALLLLLLPSAVDALETKDKVDNLEKRHGDALVAWLREDCGGFFHPSIEIRSQVNDVNGMFAMADLKENEVLMEIPHKCVLFPVKGHVKDRIESFFEDGEFYYGVITAVHDHEQKDGDDGEQTTTTYDLLYDDGDVQENAVLGENFEFETMPLNCATVRTLVEEFRLLRDDDVNNNSSSKTGRFAPYTRYLQDTQQPPESLLPSVWSAAGQALLSELFLPLDREHDHDENDEDYDPRSSQVPFGLLDVLKDDWFEACQGEPEGIFAATLTTQRAWDERLIPIYDMINHRNGRWNNVDSDEFDYDANIKVRATRPIAKGEPLYLSYNFCNDCQGRLENYGTPEVLRDYGFVEDYPRRFLFPGLMGFDLDYNDNDNDTTNTADLQLTWMTGLVPHPERGAQWLAQQLTRLQDLSAMALAERDTRIASDHEWNVIVQYHEALVTALQMALQALQGDDGAENCSSVGENDKTDQSCNLGLGRFDSLEEATHEEWADQRLDTCDQLSIYDLDSWDVLDVVTSHYQRMEISFHHKMGKLDTCFDLDNTVQICESYRPHYHEMIVHYTARFIERVERVLFVGGGDSMLLHDILKYPTLEKVVGLELDQQVVRSSFRYFGTQPHFDNEKVEWWFGDATKSLMMLPKEYFGSFDMVLVDLSETVMALTVTEELDVMQALTLMIKPDGIMVKNEVMYFIEMKDIFPHTLNLHYYDVPVVCSQNIILGSKNVAFPRAKIYDHHIDTLYKLLDDPHREVMHSYQWNTTVDEKHCTKTKRDRPSQQQESPGIMMIVEADEATSKNLQSQKTLEVALEKGLQKTGFSLVSRKVLKEENAGGTLMMLLKEGYIVSRSFPEQNYCGFDIMLWSKFEQMDALKAALAASVGSKTVSQYRIVTGGMFGLSSWREDEEKRGPEAARVDCGSDKSFDHESSHADSPDQRFDEKVMIESSKLIGSSNGSVAVLCGLEGQPCNSLNVLKKSTTSELIPLYTCSNFTDGIEYTQGGSNGMFECKKSLYFLLEGALTQSQKMLKGIVIDSTVSLPMGQIVHSLFVNTRNANRWLDKHLLTIIAPSREMGRKWRRSLLTAFRKEVVVNEPVFDSDVHLNSSTISGLDLLLLKSGDTDFIQKLEETLTRIEDSTDFQAQIISFRGGEAQFQHDFRPSQMFGSLEFDNRDATKQWLSQKLLGYQNIIQLEGKVENCAKMTSAVFSTLVKFADRIKGGTKAEELSVSNGDGCVVTAHWSGGNVVIAWDGRHHVDINLYLEDEDTSFADSFAHAFVTESSLAVTLRDVQPRGSGRVINFKKHANLQEEPHWKSSS